jgi:hypothetical protein
MHRGIEALQLCMLSRVFPPGELRKATIMLARRLTLIAPEAPYTGNRGADVAGFRNAMGAELDTTMPLYPPKSEVGFQFMKTTRKHGLRAALKWRRERFEALCKE